MKNIKDTKNPLEEIKNEALKESGEKITAKILLDDGKGGMFAMIVNAMHMPKKIKDAIEKDFSQN